MAELPSTYSGPLNSSAPLTNILIFSVQNPSQLLSSAERAYPPCPPLLSSHSPYCPLSLPPGVSPPLPSPFYPTTHPPPTQQIPPSSKSQSSSPSSHAMVCATRLRLMRFLSEPMWQRCGSWGFGARSVLVRWGA